MFCNPLIILMPLLLGPYGIPPEQREWRDLDEFRVLSVDHDTVARDSYKRLEVICNPQTPLPMWLYIHPEVGWEVVHVDLAYPATTDYGVIVKADRMAFGMIRKREWRSKVDDFLQIIEPNQPFYIRVWFVQVYEPEDNWDSLAPKPAL